MLLSVAMYYVVIRMVQPEQTTENPGMVRILLVLSITCALASFVLKKVLAARARSDNTPARRRLGQLIALALSEGCAT